MIILTHTHRMRDSSNNSQALTANSTKNIDRKRKRFLIVYVEAKHGNAAENL